jgi:hypothetical protein
LVFPENHAGGQEERIVSGDRYLPDRKEHQGDLIVIVVDAVKIHVSLWASGWPKLARL